MVRFEQAVITELRDSWAGVSRAYARAQADASRVAVLSYLEMTGPLSVGERVLVNTNALRRGLGTGGEAFVVAILDSEGAGREAAEEPGHAGHMMKARYTPVQMMVDALDDPSNPAHDTVDATRHLGALPVVVADLHSSLAPVIAGIRLYTPKARIAYIHTDWAALPVAFSAANAALRSAGLLDATISVGQSFGGDHEAVTLASALASAASVLEADVAIVTQGPGNLGTGTTWGYSGIAQADALNLVAAMGGTAIHALRVSQADPRPRHRGLSHHSATMLERLVYPAVDLPLLTEATHGYMAGVGPALDDLNAARAESGLAPHSPVAQGVEGLVDALNALPVRLSTMGRGLAEDTAAFTYAAAAGYYAAIRAEDR